VLSSASKEDEAKAMSDTTNTRNQIGIDEAFRYAVTLAWEDFKKPIKPRSIRVEYLFEPGTALDHLRVWSVRAGGYQDLVCDCWKCASPAHPSGACFGNSYYSEALGQTLLFVMMNQSRFTRPADAGRHGLILIHPPDADDRIEATTWIRGVQSTENETYSEEAPKRPEDHRQNRREEAASPADEQAYPTEGTATTPDTTGYSGFEPDEAPGDAKAADYFKLRYAWPE
jgi:hypothetical protein